MPQEVLNLRQGFADADHKHIICGLVARHLKELGLIRSALHRGGHILQFDPRRDRSPQNGAALGRGGIQRKIQLQPGLNGFDQRILTVFLRREPLDLFLQAVDERRFFQRGRQDRIIQQGFRLHLGFGTQQRLFLGGIAVEKTDRIQDRVLSVPQRQQIRTLADKALVRKFLRELRELHASE